MLDFYFTIDNVVSEYPDEENFIGGITLDQHKVLDELKEYAKEKCIDFPFFDDFVIRRKDVLDLYHFISELKNQFNEFDELKILAYLKIEKILERGIESDVNIVAYCD